MLEIAVMSRRPLPIDWGELEMALTWHTNEGGHYLDLTTGEVVAYTGLDDELTESEIDAGLAEGRLIPIEPLPSSVEYGWMAEFAASVSNASLRHRLDHALSGRSAFRRFKDALISYPSEREVWFAFRGERLRAAAREWLEENGIGRHRRAFCQIAIDDVRLKERIRHREAGSTRGQLATGEETERRG